MRCAVRMIQRSHDHEPRAKNRAVQPLHTGVTRDVVGLTSDATPFPAGCERHCAARRSSVEINDAQPSRTARTGRSFSASSIPF
jgi:hypothetical protein